MHFLNDGASSMPNSIADVHDELKRNLTKLQTNLNSSVYIQIPAIANCCTLINQLMAETYLQYLELEGGKGTAVAPSFTSGFNKTQDSFSEIRSMNGYSESHSSLKSRLSRHSLRSFKSRPSNPARYR